MDFFESLKDAKARLSERESPEYIKAYVTAVWMARTSVGFGLLAFIIWFTAVWVGSETDLQGQLVITGFLLCIPVCAFAIWSAVTLEGADKLKMTSSHYWRYNNGRDY